MLYKVYYQEKLNQVPVREKTKTLFIEAKTEGDARNKLKDRFYNIEFIQSVEGAFLEYEKQNENFNVLEI